MKRVFNETILKIIALVTMTFDHVGVFLWMVYVDTTSVGYNVGYVLRIIGRLSIPLFVFMLVEGLRHTSNKWKYCGRIAIICIPMTIVEFVIGLVSKDLSLMPPHAFTELLLFALIATLWSGKWWQKILSSIPIAYIILSCIADVFTHNGLTGFSWFPPFLWSDYDVYGLALFLGFYFAYPIVDLVSKKYVSSETFDINAFRETDDYRKLANSVSVAMLVFINVVFWALAYFFGQNTTSYLYQYHVETYSVLSGIFIFLYNGKRGYNAKWFKWFNYLYYPVHIVIIFAIFMLLFWM